MSAQAIIASAVAGLRATLLMERASSWLYEREGEQARGRKEHLRSEMPTSVLVRVAAGRLGRQLSGPQVQALGMVVHYAFGASGGPAARLLTHVGVPPLRAGLSVGAAMSVLVGELANALLGLSAPPKDFRGRRTPAARRRTPFTPSRWA